MKNQKLAIKGLVLAALILVALPLNLKAADLEKEIPNFHQVTSNIYRGGRPSVSGLKELQQLGIKTIIDLENNKKAVQTEKENLSGTPVQFVSVPFASLRTPKDADVQKVLELLNDPRNYPVYIHCQHGQDRTGLLIGLYKVFDMNWSPADAYHEMRELGFHPILFPLNRYFERKTGFED